MTELVICDAPSIHQLKIQSKLCKKKKFWRKKCVRRAIFQNTELSIVTLGSPIPQKKAELFYEKAEKKRWVRQFFRDLILFGWTCNAIYWNSDEVHIFCCTLSFQQPPEDIYMSNRSRVTVGFVKTVACNPPETKRCKKKQTKKWEECSTPVWPTFLATKAPISLSNVAQRAQLKFFNVAQRAQ